MFLRLAVFHVPAVHVNVSHLDHQLFTFNGSVQRGRVAAAFDDIDLVGGKLLAAVLADHFVTFLVIAESGTVADIAGVNGSSENTVSTFEYKKGNHGAVLRLDLEMMGFTVTDTGNRDFKLAVGRCYETTG